MNDEQLKAELRTVDAWLLEVVNLLRSKGLSYAQISGLFMGGAMGMMAAQGATHGERMQLAELLSSNVATSESEAIANLKRYAAENGIDPCLLPS